MVNLALQIERVSTARSSQARFAASGQVNEGEPAGDAALEFGAVLQTVEALGRALPHKEGVVPRVHIGGDQPGAFRIGPADHQGRGAHHVGRHPGRVQVRDMLLHRDQDLAAHVAAFLLGGQLVFEMNARGPRLDEGVGQFERVQPPPNPASQSATIGANQSSTVLLPSICSI